MFGILGLGFLLGMQHALEADHIAAVSSIAARRSHVADIVKHGLTWGLGHTLTLFAFAGAAILLGHAIPESVARPIETAVGLILLLRLVPAGLNPSQVGPQAHRLRLPSQKVQFQLALPPARQQYWYASDQKQRQQCGMYQHNRDH